MNPNQRNQVIAVGGLFAVLAGVLWFTYFRGPAAPEATVPGATDAAAAAGDSKSVFDSVNIDTVELTKNIQTVTFQYEEQRQSVDPMEPRIGGPKIATAGTTGVGGASAPRRPPSWPDLLIEATRKQVTGILWDQHNPVAIVDELVVGVGYQFEPDFAITVKEITATTVVLSVDLADKHQEISRDIKKKASDITAPEEEVTNAPAS